MFYEDWCQASGFTNLYKSLSPKPSLRSWWINNRQQTPQSNWAEVQLGRFRLHQKATLQRQKKAAVPLQDFWPELVLSCSWPIMCEIDLGRDPVCLSSKVQGMWLSILFCLDWSEKKTKSRCSVFQDWVRSQLEGGRRFSETNVDTFQEIQ